VNRLITEDGASAEQIGARQKTFSAVYDTPGRHDESEHIEKVLRATGAERNYTVPTVERMRAELERLVWHQDEPFTSTSMFAQWCVMAKARERGVTVLLDGQGADEALAGYRPFDIHIADLLRRRRYASALSAGRAIKETTGLAAAPLFARALARQLPGRHLDHLRRRRAAAGAVALRADFVDGYDARPRYSPVNRDMQGYLRELFEETSLPHLLRYEDRNSMAFSVEGRVPFLDYRLVEYSLGEAYPWCIRGGWTKWVLREAMRGTVPDEIVWRRDKVGFETPERDWLTTWLDADNGRFADDSPLARYLDLAVVRAALTDTRRDDPAAGARVWRWLNLDLWLRTFA
jgi:asparagine synthase (glutamine-hydrolysing)